MEQDFKFLLTLVPIVALKVSIQLATFTAFYYHIKHKEKNLEVNFLTLSLRTMVEVPRALKIWPRLHTCTYFSLT